LLGLRAPDRGWYSKLALSAIENASLTGWRRFLLGLRAPDRGWYSKLALSAIENAFLNRLEAFFVRVAGLRQEWGMCSNRIDHKISWCYCNGEVWSARILLYLGNS
jgi:hypothetical protein